MFITSALLALLAATSIGANVPRAAPRTTEDGPFQYIPANATVDDNDFYIKPSKTVTSAYYTDSQKINPADIPKEYQPRAIDIPFTMLLLGRLNLFKSGFNSFNRAFSTVWAPGQNDRASNSACGIPDNAYNGTKVAIHPYWLKYAPEDLGLSRYCMQDVCVSIWNETGANAGGATDIMGKVTDICSTDPKDPSYCATPADIMIDRISAYRLYHESPRGPREAAALKTGNQYPHKVWWFFSKCFQDGLLHPGYNHTSNWFASQPLMNNWEGFGIPASQRQQANNQASYPKASPPLPQYQDGGWKTQDDERAKLRFPIEDHWKPNDPVPQWCPVAGGRANLGKPPGPCPT